MKKKPKPKPKPVVKSSGFSTILWFLAVATAGIGVFWLPWFVPFSSPVVGESYALGFNNKIGILALGFSIFLAAGAVWFGRAPAADRWLASTPRFFPPWREASAEYLILIAYSAVMGGFILFWGNYLVDPAWCEARGFIYGMDLMTLGQVPYRDFMYNYGPATLYLPWSLANATGGLISVEQAYTFFVVIFTIAGYVALFVLLRSFELPKLARPVILAIGLLPWTCLSMGLQYTPLRYFMVPLSLVFLDAIASRQTAGKLPSAALAGLAAAIAAGGCLAISPEMAIAGAVGAAAYAFLLALRRDFPAALACFFGAVLVFFVTLKIFPGYLDSVFAFGGGGGNFPIYPDLHNVAMVAASLVVLPPLLVSALFNPTREKAPLALALAVAGGMLLPAAFGRCDPGHVCTNGITILYLLFPAAAAIGRNAFRVWTAFFAIVWVGLTEYSYWSQYIPNFTFAISMHDYYQAHPAQVSAWKAKWHALLLSSPHGRDFHWGKTLTFPDGLDQLTSKGRVLLTSGNEGNLWLARYLLLQKMPPREYFDAYSQGASTEAQIETKLSQDRDYTFLIIPQSALGMIGRSIDPAAYAQQTDAFLAKLLMFPVSSAMRNQPYLPDTVFAADLMKDHQVLGRFSEYFVLGPKPPASNP